ncbi:MAG: hypothetical protein RTV41_12220 [Candidatus Thorarchaeota archaeon]
MGIQLRYTNDVGTKLEREYEAEVAEIDLSNQNITHIDLSPLSCTNIQTIDLSKNKLQSIDLSPLHSCSNLQLLRLSKNSLDRIDVTPLLNINPSLYCDVGLSSWLRASSEVKYIRPTNVTSWSFLNWVATQYGTSRRIQHDILHAIGLKDYGFMDLDLEDLFLSKQPEIPIQEVRKDLVSVLAEHIVTTLKRGGPTTCLNLENIIFKHRELSLLAQRLIDLRKMEIEEVNVLIVDDFVNMKELWLTAYGHEVLSTLKLANPLFSKIELLDLVKKAFADLDIDLKTGVSQRSGVQMSTELKECIWWIAKYEGKIWFRIRKQEFGLL